VVDGVVNRQRYRMKIIIVDEKHGASKSLVLRGWMRLGLSLCLLGLPVVLGYYGFQLAQSLNSETQRDEAAQAWVDGLREQKADLERVKQETLAQLEALTIRMASLQARLIRLDALGERLTNAAGLDDGEFDFTEEPSVGGPEVILEEGSFQMPDFLDELDELAEQIESRQQQLELLDSILIERESQSEFSVSGRPVNRGYISSGFGRRIDPFTGSLAFHQGVDFSTGSTGADVFAVAAGVVTFAGDKAGFGKMVQLDHGNGFETIYAHDQKVLVKVGDVVKKGQVIALSGSTGRSSGPHVHFEVHKNGRVVDPASYIHSTVR
jgi:murein DD-endopeptidase MepM/ murein hydrolase activator NlpD